MSRPPERSRKALPAILAIVAILVLTAAVLVAAGPGGRAWASTLGSACPTMAVPDGHGCCEAPPAPKSDCPSAPCCRMAPAPAAAAEPSAPRDPELVATVAEAADAPRTVSEPAARRQTARPAHPPDTPLFLLFASLLN